MPEVFSAINNVSGVAWQIDPFVVGVVDALLKQGGGIAGLPKANPIPLPPRPTAEGELRLWKREAANIHESNKKSFSARQDLSQGFNYLRIELIREGNLKGNVKISCTDDKGRNTNIRIKVKFVDL
jgi:DNA-directed RNA polymerase